MNTVPLSPFTVSYIYSGCRYGKGVCDSAPSYLQLHVCPDDSAVQLLLSELLSGVQRLQLVISERKSQLTDIQTLKQPARVRTGTRTRRTISGSQVHTFSLSLVAISSSSFCLPPPTSSLSHAPCCCSWLLIKTGGNELRSSLNTDSCFTTSETGGQEGMRPTDGQVQVGTNETSRTLFAFTQKPSSLFLVSQKPFLRALNPLVQRVRKQEKAAEFVAVKVLMDGQKICCHHGSD